MATASLEGGPVLPGPETGRRPGRILGFSYAAVAFGLLVVILPALRPPQPPPPPTAEYAPSVNNLKVPPPEQTSQSGQGPTGTGGGNTGGNPTATPPPTASPSPTATGPTIQVPKIKHCVGNPARQTEDTQSPPCINYWDGDNGGATYQGVTKDYIYVVFQDESYNFITDMTAFFNDRYQFYGRKLVLLNGGGFCPSDPAGLQQKADGVAKTHKYFASTSCNDIGGIEGYYYDELAHASPPMISVSERANVLTDAHYAKYAPYEWNYFPAQDRIQDHLAELACAKLRGAAPAYTIPNLLFPPQRRFGVVNTKYTNAPDIDTTELFNKLQACGIQVASQDRKEVDYTTAYPTDQNVVQEASAAAVQLNADHVTTVICVCHAQTTQAMMEGATGQNYSPEWVISTFGTNDYEPPQGHNQPEQQWSHTIGVSFWNKWQPLADMPCYWAEHAANPSFNFQQSPFSEIGCQQDYNQLLVLAAGIQMAGPILTPQTFAAGLERAHFPNPSSPYYEGGVGFNGDHTMVKDAALIWYDPSTPGPYTYTAATWCYVNHGARVALGGYGSVNTSGTTGFQGRPCDP